MRFADLFSGLGGFHVAATDLGGLCVFASEINEDLCDLYEHNFGMRPEGDIRKVESKDIPDHDLLCAGFPCQPFSKAGGQLGLEDTERGNFFDKIIEVLKHASPEFVILENVAHFVKHDSGNTYEKIRKGLKGLNYDVKTEKLSPHQFGIPQIRERMYMVARKGADSLKAFNFPKPQSKSIELSLNSILEVSPPDAQQISPRVQLCLEIWQEFLDNLSDDAEIPNVPIWSMEFGATYPYQYDSLHKIPVSSLREYKGSFGEGLNYYFRKDILALVPSHARSAQKTFPGWKQSFIKQNREFYSKNIKWLDKWIPRIRQFPSSLQKLEWNCKGEERNIWNKVIQIRASGVRVKRPTTSPSIVAMTSTQVPIIGWEKRYMTVRELAKLQSLDSLKKLPEGGLAVEAFGNAVNSQVVKLILKNLIHAENGLTAVA